ncbi:DNA circularization N-terminal domain-containing protein [uncultured Zoogloea sp.]|uniref:DNA circularization N-terminal domain-containing protein n=1 Tax=uncultured Zoogloea sp. TaxID=160237 RepID=UPI0026163D4D|nr:DNA circularization N-terminal domain-containing protein [uncultured Zoogloea sp.]
MLLRDAYAFEFVTETGREIPLFGSLLSWEDDLTTGLVEHRFVNRNGARHQNLGAPPRKFSFSCIELGVDVQKRYRFYCDAITECPTGALTHPRFGYRRAACEGIKASENPGTDADAIQFVIRFSDDGFRDDEPQSPSQAAGAAAQNAELLVARTAALRYQPPGMVVASSNVLAAANRLEFAVQDAVVQAAPLFEVAARVSELQQQVEQVGRLAPQVEYYSLRAAANLSLGSALEAYAALQQGRPQILPYIVRSQISVTRLAASLYGSKARRMTQELLLLNRIADPLQLQPGAVLLHSDPRVVRASVV